jgi:hypothetical protein
MEDKTTRVVIGDLPCIYNHLKMIDTAKICPTLMFWFSSSLKHQNLAVTIQQCGYKTSQRHTTAECKSETTCIEEGDKPHTRT